MKRKLLSHPRNPPHHHPLPQAHRLARRLDLFSCRKSLHRDLQNAGRSNSAGVSSSRNVHNFSKTKVSNVAARVSNAGRSNNSEEANREVGSNEADPVADAPGKVKGVGSSRKRRL